MMANELRSDGSSTDFVISVFFMCFVLAVDHCFSNPCMNDRSCINMLDSYHCDCSSDFAGRNCEEGRIRTIFLIVAI